LIVVHYKSSSLQAVGIEVRNKKGFEVIFQGSAKWIPVDITDLSRSLIVIHITDPSKNVFGLRYAWNRKPCPNKLCAIYARGKDLPSPPFVKHGPFSTAKHADYLEFQYQNQMYL